MKRDVFVGAVLLLVAGLAAPAAQAQQCLKWVAFCDGIQIDSIDTVKGRIDAQWYHYDCANNTPMTAGSGHRPRPDGYPNACPGGPGAAGIACLATDTCGQLIGGETWTFIIDAPLDGTLDMNVGWPQSCWIDDLPYNHLLGPCVGAPQQGPGLTSSIQ